MYLVVEMDYFITSEPELDLCSFSNMEHVCIVLFALRIVRNYSIINVNKSEREQPFMKLKL